MARPKLPRDEHGEIVRNENDATEQDADEMVKGMTPAMVRALVESLWNASKAEQSSTTEALRDLIKEQGRTQFKSNAQHPGISVFSHPEGEVARPKPRLNMESWQCGVRLSEDQMTPAEITLMNDINTDRETRGGLFRIQIQTMGNRTRRMLWHPSKTTDERASLPESISLILLELATGNETLNPNFLVDEVLKLRKQVAEMAAA
jgi:hypothetical protein